MNPTQEPKYKIENGKLVNRQSGEQIPDDEPVFVLRARDIHATAVLYFYSQQNGHDAIHKQAIEKRLAQFHRFAGQHPDRMKQPDTQLTTDWS